MRIAILSDIHANFYALQSALKIIDKEGCDMMIFLGDILTYGVCINQVIDILGNRLKKKNTILVKGNHDQLYEDIISNKNSTYYKNLPVWIKETVNFTLEKMNKADWKRLNFLDYYIYNDVYFSHANPFAKNDWTYLNNSEKLIKASKILKKNLFHIGIFGHTHRILNSSFSKKNILKKNTLFSSNLAIDKTHILNSGSIGQPRNKYNPKSSFLYLNFNENYKRNIKKIMYNFEIRFFDYPLISHLKTINESLLSQGIKDKLFSFY
jgi:predicted phosphodiesterase